MRLWDYSTTIKPVGRFTRGLSNNRWVTNFRLFCGGNYEFRYILQAGKGFASVRQAMAQLRALSYPPLVMRG